MPQRPPQFRPPGMATTAERRRAEDFRRADRHEWRAWYGTARWHRIRARQLAVQPLCQRCMARGEVVAASVVHHVDAHRGDPARFWGGPFESVCKPCHDSDIQAEERGATQGGG